ILKSLDQDAIVTLLRRALNDPERGVKLKVSDEVLENIARLSSGDARCALNQLETLSDLKDEQGELDDETANRYLHKSPGHFDNHGDTFYDQISALHKSIRGSDPDAALFWLTSMLQRGCDPLYLARRLVRVASEDIGNADPRALQLALNAWETMERLGSPEGELALAQVTLYLASMPKSNAVYVAFKKAVRDIQESPDHDVPIHLRNAPTSLMKSLGYGKAYRYAHDEPEAFAAGERYFPEGFEEREYYHPVPRGMESKIKERLEYLKTLNLKARAC
ncbi:MAG: recombination factor protein RarA, partial [Gammaproteobacteria bacterium]